MRKIITLFILTAFINRGMAQEDTSKQIGNLAELSLEDLMNLSIYSVSKNEEAAFDAPVSSTVITRAEIKKAGCTSIPEALRLVPGVIVREQTNGSYDIHIRGLDNVPPNLGMYFFTNSTTLVMVDNRPVYNYLHGGTFWETLPVDLNDVEKIEVVRGPASALYGPNAESGVINIITRKPEKKGVYAVANAQYGRFNTGIANASVGYKFSDKISAHVSGNFQTRERTQRGYYRVASDSYVPLDTFVPNDSIRDARYPHPKMAMRKFGYNAFLNFKINERASIELQGGGQNSEVQNLFGSSYLTTSRSNSYYTNMRADLYGLYFQLSYLAGVQAPQTGVVQWKWDFNTTDVVLEYRLTKVKNLSLTPGISYRRASYDDRKYVNEAIKEGFFSANVNCNAIAAYLRADYLAFNQKLRLIAAGRVDKFFNGPKKPYFSWQLAATYKATPNHMIRIVQSRANRSPLLIDHYLDVAADFTTAQAGPSRIELLGERNLKLLTTDMLEIGYRGRVKEKLEIDFVVFGSWTRNYDNIIYQSGDFDSSRMRTLFVYRFENLPVYVRQLGATISLTALIGKFHIRPFISVQQTTIFDYSPYGISPGADSSAFNPNPANNKNSGLGTKMKHLATPAVYGGAYLNCQVTPQLNINLNPYFMSGYTQLESSNITYNDGKRGVEKVSFKLILNASVSYTFFKRLTVFMNFKNCFNDKTREFYRGDIADFKVLGGASFEF